MSNNARKDVQFAKRNILKEDKYCGDDGPALEDARKTISQTYLRKCKSWPVAYWPIFREAVMKNNAHRIILVFIVLTMFDVASVSAQDSKKGLENLPIDMLKTDTSVRMQEPHHVLAMAYRQTIRIFAKALLDQAQSGGALSADFARALVTEMNRNFDNAEDHYKEHLKPTSADGRFMTAPMIKEMDISLKT